MSDLDRSLVVLADGEPVTGFVHAKLTGRDALGLYPQAFLLRLWNLSDPDYHRIAAAKAVSVKHGDSVLASGSVTDLYRETVPEGTVTKVVFSLGIGLWEAPVSLSVEAGVSVSETVRRILEESGTGIALLSFPGEDPVRSRCQAFYGRAAECVEEALSAADVRCCLTPSGLCVIPSSGLPVSMELSNTDLIDAPSRVGNNLVALRTRVTGWPLGKQVSVKWKGQAFESLVSERSVDADNLEGNWQSELLVEAAL